MGRIGDAFGSMGAWLRGHPGVVRGFALGVVAFITLVAGLAIGSWRAVCRDCPSVAQIYAWEPKEATRLLDRDGKLFAELFEERRTPVQIETLPEHVAQAFVAVEDKRFYEHEGLDYRRIISANIQNVLSGRITGGGSTITQQLARNMFEEGIGFEQRVARKLKEFKVAKQIEQVYPKNTILEAYINLVNYGHGWRGIETASQHYFGKAASQLNPAEAAMLAAAVNRPGLYSPFINAEATLNRRNTVLRLMADQGYLSQEEKEQWQQQPLPGARHTTDVGKIAPYFVEWVRTTLEPIYGTRLYSGGLRIYTTLDVEMQRFADSAMAAGWTRIENRPGYRAPTYAETMADEDRTVAGETPYLQGLFIALEPGTGEVRALVGGRDFVDSKFNRATQAVRQPGSTFKPFVYYAALNSGVPPSTILYDAPLSLALPDGSIYAPGNYDPDFRGPVLMREALQYSINTVTVRLGVDIGLETVAQTAREFGLRTNIPAYPSMPIGAADVVPMQLAEAYTVFATGGTRARARPILRVEDADGTVLWQPPADVEQVANPQAVAITRSFMETALNNGSGHPARDPAQGNLPYTIPAAGKTGTTNDYTDVWFAGFTPDLVAVVWFGFDRPRRIMNGAAGGLLAAPVWGDFMRRVYIGDNAELPTPEPFAWPSGIVEREIDAESGRLANEWCPTNVVPEYFIAGTEPAEACSPYRGGLFGAPLRGVSPPDTTSPDTIPPGTRRRRTPPDTLPR
ncbi:MAG TPA: PBP1A family penicillin-binding protein [Longimicrobiales bacterium]|nr:PBP1A family penicillin-binding protein [Longimicrobiales bacterium]